MRGEGVAKTVRMDGGIASDQRGVELHDAAPAAVGEPPAAMIEKQGHFAVRALRKITIERFGGLPAEGHLALLAALPAHPQPTLGAVQIVQVEPYQFAHSQPATV